MQTIKLPGFVAASVLAALAFPSFCSAEPILGDAPTAPKDVSNLPRGPMELGVTGGFTVNTDSREEVRSFYIAVYTSSDGVPMNTTANVSTCTPGTNAATYQEAVLRRINWFRAMAGLPASVTLNTTNNSKDQEAAVMMSANTNLSHSPPPTWHCYTFNGATASSNSNLALGDAGADAITGYIWDYGANNNAVGHRRWLLYPQTQVMGTGDVPQQGSFKSANATWVFDGNYGGPRPATRKSYVSWPPAGYVPYPVVYPRWSFALSNANFTNATVNMKSNGVPVTVSTETYQIFYGENTIVWVPMGLNPNDYNTVFPFGGTDTVYTVAVSNIHVGVTTTNYAYTVTVFDPAVPGADYHPPVISGPNQPGAGQNNAYTFTAVSNATSYQWRSTLRTPYNFNDGAESGLGNFTVNTSLGYAVQQSSVVASGSYSFHLAHPSPPTDQTLTLNQVFVPRTNTLLKFKSQLGYAADGQSAKVQISTNGGTSWVDLFSQTGDLSGYPIETAFTNRSLSLAAYTGNIAVLRFNYHIGVGSYYYQTSAGVGWYIDDIVITNAEIGTVSGTNATATTNFTFNPSQSGTYNLEVQALIFTEFPLGWGPAKEVNVMPAIMLGMPVVTNGQVRLDFTVTSNSAATFKLLQVDQLGAAWITNTGATLTTNVPGSSYRFTTTVGPSKRFYRIQAP